MSNWTGAIATRSEPITAGAALAILAVAMLAACGAGSEDRLLVSAAASLTDVFTVIEERFESEHPTVDVLLNLGATATLRRQIIDGASAAVFASADAENMALIEAAELVAGEATAFATNRLEIAVQRGNPTGVAGLADFADQDRLVGLCAPQVPCGRLARQALSRAGVTPSVDSEEPNVRALLNKIAIGELDAGIVYVTDVTVEPRVEGVGIPNEVNVENRYLIAALAGGDDPGLADAFVDYVLSPAGQAALETSGFGPP